jgi:chromosome partitioning protein
VPTIALVSNKGGAGKTTLSMNLAAGLGRREPCVLLDADPQGSSLQWAIIAERPEGSVLSAHEDLAGRLDAQRGDYPFQLIDCPPSIHAPQTRTALGLADIALIPVQPSPVDLWATAHIAQVVEEVRASNPALRAYLVVNQLEARTTLSKLIGSALDELDLPALRTTVQRRAVYRNCVLEGRSVYEMGVRGAPAVAEIEGIINEVLVP